MLPLAATRKFIGVHRLNRAKFSLLILGKNRNNCCQQMSDFKAKNAPNLISTVPTQTPLAVGRELEERLMHRNGRSVYLFISYLTLVRKYTVWLSVCLCVCLCD